jgi:hypothetical protein
MFTEMNYSNVVVDHNKINEIEKRYFFNYILYKHFFEQIGAN